MTNIPKYISEKEFLKGRGPISPELRANMERLLDVINRVRHEYGKPFYVTSGYRSPEINKAIGGAPNSAHLRCTAIDIADPDGAIGRWIKANDILEKYDLYMEDLSVTQRPGKSWVHLTYEKKSKREFMP